MDGFLLVLLILIVVVVTLALKINQTPEQRAEELYGSINHAMVCPHCQERGNIRTKSTEQKKGLSGGKTTAAVLTGGISLLATGLSRKEKLTQAHCANCNNTWYF